MNFFFVVSRLVAAACLFFLFLLFAAFRAGPLQAAVYRVTTIEDTVIGCGNEDPECSLRAAVILANQTDGLDEIILPFGVYRLTISDVIVEDFSGGVPLQQEGGDEETGDLDITDHLTIRGEGESKAVITTELPIRLLDIHGPVSVQLVNLWISGGDLSQTEQPGGGIRASSPESSVNLEDVSVFSNQAYRGGGISSPGRLALSRSSISENTATHSGGGIYSSFGSLVLNESELGPDNRAPDGGGAFLEASDLLVTSSSIHGNVAAREDAIGDGSGGGFRIQTDEPSDQSPEHLITQSVLFGNSAELGGAISADNPTLELINVTISGNSATDGAAIAVDAGEGSLSVTHTTIARNQTLNLESAGLLVIGQTRVAVSISNSILAENSPSSCGGLVTSLGGNLFTDDSCNPDDDDLTGVTEPIFGALRDNDFLEGNPLTHALLPGSKAIDGANSSNCPAQDQRGARRFSDGDGDGVPGCDIGAYEAPPFQPGTLTFSAPAALTLGDPLAGYRMIGSPLQQTPPPSDFLVDVLGESNPFRWRMLRYDSENRAYRALPAGPASSPDPFFDFEVGRGFWVIAAIAFEATVEGVPNDASGPPYELDLEANSGWQQIVSPFNFPLDWSECVATRLPETASTLLVGYRDDDFSNGAAGYVPVGEMLPGEAYWFYVTEGHLASHELVPQIEFPPLCAAFEVPVISQSDPGRRTAGADRRVAIRQSPNWRVQLSAISGAIADAYNYFGVAPSAGEGVDRLDEREPPPIHDLMLYFRRSEVGEWPFFASDFRPVRRLDVDDPPARTWQFEVLSNRPGRVIHLQWKAGEFQGKSLMLWDLEAGKWTDMLAVDRYSYVSFGKGIRRFEIVQR